VSTVTLTGGRVVDPAAGRDEITSVTVDGEAIAAVGEAPVGEELDVSGLVIAPGLVDLHTHLREPGGEDAETVATGTAAAAAGGFTAVCAMPNTDPTCDHAGVVEQVLRLAAAAGHCEVHPVGAITRGRAGSELAELGAMTAAGVRCFSDDGAAVGSARVMRQALAYARTWDAIVCDHAEEPDLADGGQMNEAERSARLGLPGRPREAEEVAVARDLVLAHGQGARLHLAHLTTAGAVELVRTAKARGTRVTAEVTPHHLCLTEELADTYDPVYKVNPPLRTPSDLAALRAGLVDGTIDAVATDHAPHARQAKEDQEWAAAPPGVAGLETALAVILAELVGETGGQGDLTLAQAIAALSTNPARSRDLAEHGGPIAPGAPANLVVFDPNGGWQVDPPTAESRGRNTPFAGRRLPGRVVHTMLRGRFTCRDGEVTG
jgi:dihydroorotase